MSGEQVSWYLFHSDSVYRVSGAIVEYDVFDILAIIRVSERIVALSVLAVLFSLALCTKRRNRNNALREY
ncbi:g protein alpha subunit [Moniliophthora roreri]|nr:g protein alpha subunit [Moniliophthora roreri]